jgi:hypothetical protein
LIVKLDVYVNVYIPVAVFKLNPNPVGNIPNNIVLNVVAL